MGFLSAMLAKTWTRVLLYITLVGAIGIGVGTALWHRSQVERAQSFVEVQGEVVRSEVVRNSDNRPSPRIDATYEYEGTRGRAHLLVALGVEGEGKLEPEELIARYPVGAPIAVFVNPEDPSEAVLYRSFDPSSLIGGTVLATLLLGYVIWLDRKRRRGTPATATIGVD